MEKVKSKRIDFVDFFRFLGILLMIMGHIGFGGIFDKWIHAFHMPMFFFISGYFYKRKNIHDQLKSKMRSLLIPYLTFGICQLLIIYFIRNKIFVNACKSYLFTNYSGISPVPGALWFLTALFIAEFIYILIRNYMKNDVLIHFVVFFIMMIGMIIPYVGRLPWSADVAFVGVGFLHIGYVMRNSERLSYLLNLNLISTFILSGIILALIFINDPVNLRTASYGIVPLFLLNSVGSIFVGWNLSRFITSLLKTNNILSSVLKVTNNIGKNSIVFLCLNQIVIIANSKVLNLVFNMNSLFLTLLARVLLLLLTLFELYIIDKCICNTKLKFLIGR